jgi:hypothetical protein
MTERTSHLAGLWISSAISNTFHSNKVGSTIVKRARLKVKDQGRRQCCHDKHKKLPYRPTRDVYLLSGHASYLGIRRRSPEAKKFKSLSMLLPYDEGQTFTLTKHNEPELQF